VGPSLTPDPPPVFTASRTMTDLGSRAVLWFAIELERTTEVTEGPGRLVTTGLRGGLFLYDSPLF